MHVKMIRTLLAGTAMSMCLAVPAVAGGKITSMSENTAGRGNYGYSENYGLSAGASESNGYGYNAGRSYAWPAGETQAEETENKPVFGWLDEEGFHVANSSTREQIDADNEEQREQAGRTGRVYGWLDEDGFHNIEDVPLDGDMTEEMHARIENAINNYNEMKDAIEEAKDSFEGYDDDEFDDDEEPEDELFYDENYDDENYDDEDYDDEDYDDEDYDDASDMSDDADDFEEDQYDGDEEDPEYDDQDEMDDLYSETLINTIDALSNTTVSEGTGEDAESLIEGRKPSYVIVEEDVFDAKNTYRNESKNTETGKEKSNFGNGYSENHSFSNSFGAGSTEGTGTVKGRRIYYIYDLREEN